LSSTQSRGNFEICVEQKVEDEVQSSEDEQVRVRGRRSPIMTSSHAFFGGTATATATRSISGRQLTHVFMTLLHERREPEAVEGEVTGEMASSAAKKKLVVAGGTGFLGSRICKSAVARGWDVTSIR
jgi:FlaA1/EpsC-like NDP-sugar epimerase